MTTNPSPIYDSAPPGATALLRFRDIGCGRIMGHLFEDDDGRLWLTNRDRLQSDAGWWRNEETVEVLDDEHWQYLGCPNAGLHEGCGQAFSWQLLDDRPKLAQARAESRVIEVGL